jgi:CPA2 family monovalent cation:H+ antiporter-2
VLALAATGLAIFQRLKLPEIAGFLVVGAIAGPGALGLVSDTENVLSLAEIGVIILLFEIGLELPIEKVRLLWRSALVAGGIQVTLTLALVAGGAYALGLPATDSVLLGALIAISSTALVMRLLSERGQLNSPHGQLAVSVLIFQDLSVVPLLLAIPILAGDAGGSPLDVGLTIVRIVAALAFVFVTVRFVVPRVLELVAQLRSPDLFSLLALLLVLGSAVIAEGLGLTLAVGAFLAGVAATASPYAHQLFAEVVPLRGVMLGIFFTAVGMLFEPARAVMLAPQILGYLAATVLLKSLVIAGIATFVLRRDAHTAVLTGLTLAQTGEFSFVLLAAAAGAGLVGESLRQVVIAGSILSLIGTPWLVQIAPRIAEWFARGVEQLAPKDDAGDSDTGHVIVAGYGLGGQTLIRLLRSLDTPYLAIDANAEAVQEARARGENIIFGDATRPPVLKRLGVTEAKLIAIVISDPIATRSAVTRARNLAPHTPILARTRFVRDVDELYDAGATVVVAEEFEGSLEVASQTLELFEIPVGAIRNFTDALREEGYGAIRVSPQARLDPWLTELLQEVSTQWIEVPGDFEGETSMLSLGIRERTGANIVGVDRDGVMTANPAPIFELTAGDRLLVIANSDQIRELNALLAEHCPES